MHSVRTYNLPGPLETPSTRQPGPGSQSGYNTVQQWTLNQWNAPQSIGLSSGQPFTSSPQSNSNLACLQSSPGNSNCPLGPEQTLSYREPGPEPQSGGYYSVQQRTLNQWNAPQSLGLSNGQPFTSSPQANSNLACLQSSPGNGNHPLGPQQTLGCREPGPESQSGGYYSVQQRTLNQWNAPQSHGLSSGQSFMSLPQSNSSLACLQSSPGNGNHPLGSQQTLSCREPGPESQNGHYSQHLRTLNQWNASQSLGLSSGQSFTSSPQSNSNSACLQPNPGNRNHPLGSQQSGHNSPQLNTLILKKTKKQWKVSNGNPFSLSSQPSSGSANPQVVFTGPQSKGSFRTPASFSTLCPNTTAQLQLRAAPFRAPAVNLNYHAQLPQKNTTIQDNNMSFQNIIGTSSWFPSNGSSVLENNKVHGAVLPRHQTLREKHNRMQTLHPSADQPQQTSSNDLVNEESLRFNINQGQMRVVRNGAANSCTPGSPPVTQTSTAPSLPPPYEGSHVTVNSFLNLRVHPLNRPQDNVVVQRASGQLINQSSTSLPQHTEHFKVFEERQTRQAVAVPRHHSKNLPSLPALHSSKGPQDLQSNSTTGVLTWTSPTSGTSPTGEAPHSNTERRDGQMSGEGHREVELCTESAECLKLVKELQKAVRQACRAIAVVPPISQQSGPVQKEDVTTTADDSLPFKIDAVWTLAKDCESVEMEDNTPKDLKELFELPSVQQPQTQESIKPGSDSVIDTESCKMPLSTSGSLSVDVPQTESGPISKSLSSKASQAPVCVNDLTAESAVQQTSDVESCIDDSPFNLSKVPEIDFTLEKLQQLITSLEATPAEKGKETVTDVIKCILDLYWGGNIRNMGDEIKSENTARWTKMVPKMCVNEKQGVVLQYLAPENLKRLSCHCHILQEDITLPPKRFKPSWWSEKLADIDKVLAEPVSEDDFTWCQADSQSVFDVNSVESLSQLCGNDAGDQVVANQDKNSEISPDRIAERVISDCLSESVGSPEALMPASVDHQVDVRNQEEDACESKSDTSKFFKKPTSEKQDIEQHHGQDQQVQGFLHSDEIRESLTKSSNEINCDKDHRSAAEEANSPKAKLKDLTDLKTWHKADSQPVFSINSVESLSQLCGNDAGDQVVANQDKNSEITSHSVAEQRVISDCLSEPVGSPEALMPASVDHQGDVINQEEDACENKSDTSKFFKKPTSEKQDQQHHGQDQQVQGFLHSDERQESLTKSSNDINCDKDHRNAAEEANSPKAKPKNPTDVKTCCKDGSQSVFEVNAVDRLAQICENDAGELVMANQDTNSEITSDSVAEKVISDCLSEPVCSPEVLMPASVDHQVDPTDMKTQKDKEKIHAESSVPTSNLSPSDHEDDDGSCESESFTSDPLPQIILSSDDDDDDDDDLVIIEDCEEQDKSAQSCRVDPNVLTVFSLSGNREIWSHGPSNHVQVTCPHVTDITSGTDHICPKCLTEMPLLDLDLDESLFSPKAVSPSGMSSPIKPDEESCSPQAAILAEPLCIDDCSLTESDLSNPKVNGPEATQDPESPKAGRQSSSPQSSVPPNQELTKPLRKENHGKTEYTKLVKDKTCLVKSSGRAKLIEALPHLGKAKSPQAKTSLLKYLRLCKTGAKPADNISNGQSSRNEIKKRKHSPIEKNNSSPTEAHPYSSNGCRKPQVSSAIETPSKNVMHQRLKGPEYTAQSDDRQEREVKNVKFLLYGSQSRDFHPPHSRQKFPPAPVYINVSAATKTSPKYTGMTSAKRKVFIKSRGRFVQKQNISLCKKGQKDCENLLKDRIEIQKTIMRERSIWKSLKEKKWPEA